MKVYNTLTKKKEEVKPLEGNIVRIYSCGPTVYNYAHIGNLRTYVFMDLLRKVLKYNGYDIFHVMNITDVGHLVSDSDEGEDKMLKTARSQNKTPWEIAQYYTEVFFKDIEKLNIERPELTPKATEHIKEMLEFVETLLQKGFAYETSDGIYFGIEEFADYGKLSGLDLEGQQAGARVDINVEKHHPADFAIWKKAPREHIMQWESPWGMGYPGWHIECSAMSRKYLGDYFDIHTGGVDHIPVHHENEIAQSEALLGHSAVKTWMHGEFLLVDNGKMSKSLNNTYTVSNLEEKGYSPLAFRYLCLNGNYRNKLNFTWEALKASQTALDRLYALVSAHKGADNKLEDKVCNDILDKFKEAINDDLNIPLAMACVWEAAKYPVKSNDIFELLLEMDKIISLDFDKIQEKVDNEEEYLEPEIMEMLNQRIKARADKNYALSDEIRDKLFERGIGVKDTKDGMKWERLV